MPWWGWLVIGLYVAGLPGAAILAAGLWVASHIKSSDSNGTPQGFTRAVIAFRVIPLTLLISPIGILFLPSVLYGALENRAAAGKMLKRLVRRAVSR